MRHILSQGRWQHVGTRLIAGATKIGVSLHFWNKRMRRNSDMNHTARTTLWAGRRSYLLWLYCHCGDSEKLHTRFVYRHTRAGVFAPFLHGQLH
jgi:hypothetical protein